MPDTNYTALAAECEKKAEQGEKPGCDWEFYDEESHLLCVDYVASVTVTPTAVTNGDVDTPVFALSDQLEAETENLPTFKTRLSAQLFAEALLRDATKPLHRKVYEVRDAYAVAARVIALHLKDQSTPELESLTYDQYISELARKSGAEINALRTDLAAAEHLLHEAVEGAKEHEREMAEIRAENQRLRTALGKCADTIDIILYDPEPIPRGTIREALNDARAALSPDAPTAANHDPSKETT